MKLKANFLVLVDSFPIGHPYPPLRCLDLNGKGDTLLTLRDTNAVTREVHSHLQRRMAYPPVTHGTGKSCETPMSSIGILCLQQFIFHFQV